MKKYCFIDVDGVVANFCKSAFELHGSKEPEEYPAGPNWIPECLGMTDQQFWSKVDRAFWEDLKLLPDAHKIMDMITGFVPIGQCCFLTSPTLHCDAAAGKMYWISKHFPKFKRRFLIGACKEMCAGPNKILIDDLEHNINMFKNAGGTGLLLPRPWNNLRHLNTLTVLEDRLTEFVNEEDRSISGVFDT